MEHVNLQINVWVVPNIFTMMVQSAQHVQVLLIVWKCIVMHMLIQQSVPTVKGLLGPNHTTELTKKVVIESSVYKLVLGEQTALGVTQETVPGS